MIKTRDAVKSDLNKATKRVLSRCEGLTRAERMEIANRLASALAVVYASEYNDDRGNFAPLRGPE